LLIHFF